MLRLINSTSALRTTVELDGKLVGPWVEEVRKSVATLRAERIVCLDLQHLSYADMSGLGLLWSLQIDGVEFIGVPPLIAGLLEMYRERFAHHAGKRD